MIGRLVLAAALAGVWPSAASACSILPVLNLIQINTGSLAFTPDPLLVVVAGRPQAMTVTVQDNGLLCALGNLVSGLLCILLPGLCTQDYQVYAWVASGPSDPSGRGAPTINGVSLPSSQPGSPNLTLTFHSGVAGFNLNTTDVGQYNLKIGLPSQGLLNIGNGTAYGQSSQITTRPFGLAITDIKNAGGTANPGGTTATSTVFAKAGENFQATVGAYLWSAADDANNDGVPDAGADITNNGLCPHFAGDVGFAAEDITPAGGTIGTVSGTVAAAGGTGTGTTISYSEVGSMYLRPAANFLGIPVPGMPKGPVGRFIPDHFTISGAALANRGDLACPASTFTYMGEPMKLDFTLTAQNAPPTNGTTVNYTGAFARLDGTAAANWPAAGGSGNSGMGLAMVDTNAGLAVITPFPGRAAVTGTLTAAWDKGVGIFSAGALLGRPVNLAAAPSPDGPYTHVEVGIYPQDPDGVKVLDGARDLDADNDVGHAKERVKVSTDFKTIRFGRLRLLNAHGSELLRLPVPLFAEFWNGSGFIKNRDDSCTQVPVPASVVGGGLDFPVTAGNNLAAEETTATLGGVTAGSGTLASGDGGLWLSRPGAGNHGYVNLSLTAPDYLKYNWNGTDEGTDGNWFDDNPTARARFGVYKNANEFIYMRENY